MTSTLSASAIHRVIFLVENDDRPTFAKEKKRQLPQRPIPWHLLPAHCYADHLPNSAWKAIYRLYFDIKPAPPLDYLFSLELALILKDEVDVEDVRAIFAYGKPLVFWACPGLLMPQIVGAFSELHQEPSCIDVTITPIFGLGPITPSEAWPQVYTTHLPCHACTTVGTFEERSLPRLRGPATLMLLPDFASEVFGFLDRAHIGASLLTNRGLHDVIFQLTKRLPVHHLTCAFEKERFNQVYVLRVGGAYWLEIRHFQRDLSYINTRHFKVPSAAGAEHDCDLIRRYLGNCHVADLQAPADSPFAFKMLASLAPRNFSIGRMELGAEPQRFADYRSMDTILGGLRISDLDLRCEEHRFVELVKTTDFFRTSTVQKLRKLKLTLSKPEDIEQKPRGHARSKSPLWISGIYLMPKCAYYRVYYWPDRHLRLIERRMVQICEEFERGKITDIVEHLQFRTTQGMNYAFNRDNLLRSGVKVEGKKQWERINHFEWDVYRFQNASTSEHLTACVGQDLSFHNESILHIVKGEVYPDASFADY